MLCNCVAVCIDDLDIEAVVAEGEPDDRNEALGGDGTLIDERKTLVVVDDACRVRRGNIQPHAHQQRKKRVLSHLDIRRGHTTRLASRVANSPLPCRFSFVERKLFRLVSRIDNLVERLDNTMLRNTAIDGAHGRACQREREKQEDPQKNKGYGTKGSTARNESLHPRQQFDFKRHRDCLYFASTISFQSK